MLGERLAAARKSRGLTQWDLAVALGDRYRQSTISAIERGHSSMHLEGVKRAAQELRVSVDWLAGLTDDPTPPDERAPTVPVVNEPVPTVAALDVNLEQIGVFAVSGDSMYPTVPEEAPYWSIAAATACTRIASSSTALQGHSTSGGL